MATKNIVDKLFKPGEVVEITDSNENEGIVKIIQVKQGWVRVEQPSEKAPKELEYYNCYGLISNMDSSEEAVWINIAHIKSVVVYRSQRHAKENNW